MQWFEMMRRKPALAIFWLAGFAAVLLSGSVTARAQSGPEPPGRLVLVLPFENRSSQPGVDWIAESFPVVLNQRVTTAGFLPITRTERLYGLDRLGLPQTLRPSRATAYRLAAEMDADYVIIGNYSADNGIFSAQAQVLDVHRAHMSAPLQEQNVLGRLVDVENQLAWRAIREMDPTYSVSQASFLATVSQLRLDAFESFVRGILASDPAEKNRRLEQAVKLSPDYVPALYQLGRSYFASQEYELAIAQFLRVPSDHPLAMQAAFYLALAQFYTGQYAASEQSFAFVASRLPLPEVINNQGVAASRHGKNGTSQFQQAVTADPKDEDYHFNLAVSLRRQGDFAGAAREIQAALALRPQDTEAHALQSLIASKQKPAAAGADADNNEPLERLKREFNETTVRQAAFALEQMEQARLSTQPPPQRAAAQAADGDRYLAEGLLLEAEQSYQDALRSDPQNAAAHAGLADVRLRTGDFAAARGEANTSLKLQPNALAYVVLGSAQLQDNQLAAAATSVSRALELQPQNAGALQLKRALAQRGVTAP